MGAMFYACTSLASLDLSNFDTSNVINMGGMFYGCMSLTSLDLSNFNTSNVVYMNEVFAACTSLKSIDLSNFETSNVEYLDAMFALCIALEDVDVSSFNTSNVVSMRQMFAYCFAQKTLDLSSFDTSNVQYMDGMFNSDPEMLSYLFTEENPEVTPQLTTIYVSSKWNTDAVESGRSIFYGCTSLVGGAGTVYNASFYEENPSGEDVQYARIDGGTEAPGFFTEKVISAIIGDVTGDGIVNAKDVNKLVNIILGKVTSYDATIADVNEDKVVNISDVTALVNMLLKP